MGSSAEALCGDIYSHPTIPKSTNIAG